MLNKEKMKEMFQKEQYEDILYLFKKEYKQMIVDYAKRNKIEVNEDTDMEDLLILIPEKDSNLSGCMSMITSILYAEDKTIFENLDDMLSNYNHVKQMLT